VRAIVRTKGICIQIDGVIPSSVLEALREEYGPYLILRVNAIESMVDIMHAPLYARVQKELSPGGCLKLYRQDQNLTQRELGEKLGGVPRQNIGGMENGRRPISRMMAVRLAGFFGVSSDKFRD
jgi:DNA-binding XRE family transcriptional regulator